MNISRPFIRRPVATLLMSLALTMAGLVAYKALAIASLPKIEFPAIAVSASMPGASADVMTSAVATPLIEALSAIASVETVSATSLEGTTTIVVEFELSRDIDQAAADVQAAIARAQPELPSALAATPSYRKLDPTDAPVLLLVLTSATRSLAELDAFARTVIVPELTAIDGVADVVGDGGRKYAVRIHVDPYALAARNIALDEIERAVRAASDNAPVGALVGEDRRIVLQATTQLSDAAQFRDLVVATPDGRPIRLGEVARVIDSVEEDDRASRYDGTDAIVLSVKRQSDADMVSVAESIRSVLPRLQDRLGPDASIEIVNDRSVSVVEAVDDVETTMILTVVLMFAVMYCLTGRFSATAIPSIVVPVSIAVTFVALYAFGLSLNNITLLALTLSIGLIVDDAIVMHENIVRHVESGVTPVEAAIKGSGEVGFTIVSMTLSLGAVFIPVLLMEGIVGRILNSFAVTVIVALIASALVSITLTPMIAAYWLKPVGSLHRKKGVFERGFDRLAEAYRVLLDLCLRFRPVMLLVFLATVVATVWMLKTIPKGFLPQEDIGQLEVSVHARPDVSFPAMVDLQGQAEAILRESAHVAHVLSEVGAQGSAGLNESRFFVQLKGKAERPAIGRVIAELRESLALVPGIEAAVMTAQSARMGGGDDRGAYQFSIQAETLEEIARWSEIFTQAMETDPAFASVASDLQNTATQTTIDVDRDKADRLGISSQQIRATLHGAFGGRQVATIHRAADSHKVFIEIDPAVAGMAERLGVIRIRAAGGALVPLSAIASFEPTTGLRQVNQIGRRPAVTISFDLSPGTALGEAVARIEAIGNERRVPDSVTIAFGGTARVFQEAMAHQGLLLAAAVLTIYIVLGILYESLIHPLTILTGLPAAAVGALAALTLLDMELSLMALIGLLILIGIAKKNAIMMIDVALVLQRDGAGALEAIRTACLRRFRPIMMTTMAAIAGALPIAVGYGTSAELRQPLGVAVGGGLVLSQLLTLFITPVIFLYMDAIARRSRAVLGRLRPASAGLSPPERIDSPAQTLREGG